MCTETKPDVIARRSSFGAVRKISYRCGGTGIDEAVERVKVRVSLSGSQADGVNPYRSPWPTGNGLPRALLGRLDDKYRIN